MEQDERSAELRSGPLVTVVSLVLLALFSGDQSGYKPFDGVVQGYYVPYLNHCWPNMDGNNSDSVLDWFESWNRTNAPQN